MGLVSLVDDRTEIEQQIIERAWRDDAFKQELLSNPHAAALKMGLRLPATLNIVVHEETPDTIHFVLPENPAVVADSELSDSELELIAGGGGSSAHSGVPCTAYV